MSMTSIDDLTLDTDISSKEGISLNYISRDRMSFLMGQNKAMVAQTQFADAKAGAMLAFVGLIATRGPAAATNISLHTATSGQIGMLALHSAAMICCLIVLYPRYAHRKLRREIARKEKFSWPALIGQDGDMATYSDFMRTAQVSQMVISVANSNFSLARILHSKFAWLRAAFVFACLDILLVAIQVMTGA